MDMTYQNESYWRLPENVRAAIDKAKSKNQKSVKKVTELTINDCLTISVILKCHMGNLAYTLGTG